MTGHPFDDTYIRSIEFLGCPGFPEPFSRDGDEWYQEMAARICETLSPRIKDEIMKLGPLQWLSLRLDGRAVSPMNKCHDLTFQDDNAVFVHYSDDLSGCARLGEGTVLIADNSTDEVLYHGSDGMD
jgi:hypothetical protein